MAVACLTTSWAVEFRLGRQPTFLRHGRARPGHPRLACCGAEGRKTWMPGTSSAKTRGACHRARIRATRWRFWPGMTNLISARDAVSRLDVRPKSSPYVAPSCPERGAYRDRHGRWDGMRWTRQRRRAPCDRRATQGARTNDVEADGEVVWF
jgi:hypothetical protein